MVGLNPYRIFQWQAEYPDWNVGTTFTAPPIDIEGSDGRVWRDHPKAGGKVAIRRYRGEAHGGEILSWDAAGGTGIVRVCDTTWHVKKVSGDTWQVVG